MTVFRNARRAQRRADVASTSAGVEPVDPPLALGSRPPYDPSDDEELPELPHGSDGYRGGNTGSIARNRSRGARHEERGEQSKSKSGSGSNTPGKRENGRVPCPDPDVASKTYAGSLAQPGVRLPWILSSMEMDKVPEMWIRYKCRAPHGPNITPACPSRPPNEASLRPVSKCRPPVHLPPPTPPWVRPLGPFDGGSFRRDSISESRGGFQSGNIRIQYWNLMAGWVDGSVASLL